MLDKFKLILEGLLELFLLCQVVLVLSEELVNSCNRSIDGLLNDLNSSHKLRLEVSLQIIDLLLDFTTEFVRVKFNFRGLVQFLKFASEISSHLDVFRFNLLFQLEHELQ